MKTCCITFVGDISLNGIYNDLLIKNDPSYPFEQIKDQFSRADIIVGNLESPLVSSNQSPEYTDKTPLRADPEYAKGLRMAGFNVMNLSNNHILDYGEQGVAATLDLLNANKIEYFGYGDSYAEVKRLKIVPVGSMKIGFMGYTDIVIDSPFYASEHSRGIAKFDVEMAKEEAREAKKKVDALIVSLHWGIEYFHLPSPEQIAQARALIECGADVIMGHHPHIIQGVEQHKNGLIAYSLGNFIFSDIKWEWQTAEGEKRITYYNFSQRNRKSFILQVSLDKSGVKGYSLIGTYLLKSGQVVLDPKVNKDIQILSDILIRTDYKKYFIRQLTKFRMLSVYEHMIPRLKKFYKLRPKHFREIMNIIWSIKQSG